MVLRSDPAAIPTGSPERQSLYGLLQLLAPVSAGPVDYWRFANQYVPLAPGRTEPVTTGRANHVVKYYPISYVRSYAMTQSEVESTFNMPYYGFNLGSTQFKLTAGTEPKMHISKVQWFGY